jgi:hypothetical protein
VCLAIWRTKPTRELFEIQRSELSSAVARDPGKVAFLCVVESKADPPEQEVRDASSAMISDALVAGGFGLLVQYVQDRTKSVSFD